MRLLSLSLLCAAILGTVNASAGQWKRITIDGSFDDWAGVTPANVDAQDSTGTWDLKDVYLANDDEFLYVRVTLYAPGDYGSFHHHVLIDADANAATGYPTLGIGSELLIEDGSAYQQKNGTFNEGNASGLDWAQAPTGKVTEYEARISRNVRDAENLPVLANSDIVLALEVLNSSWTRIDAAPDTGGIAYSLAPTPSKATGTKTLVSLSSTQWRYNDAKSDLGTNWLASDYDDTQSGWKSGAGLFGFGSPAGTYPAAIQTTLASGSPTYYLRVPFSWNYDSSGIALSVDSYLSDGAVFYLNGMEVKRLRLPAGPIGFSTLASGAPATPGKAEILTFPPSALVVGDNMIEVEVHASSSNPSKLAFGLSLIATDSLPPSIADSTLPADRSVVEGESTSFSVGSVMGTVPLLYQWFKDGTAVEQGTNATLTIPMVLESDAGGYRVEISNATGAKATSRTAQLTTTALSVAITNNAEPANRTITEGESTTFTVPITGSLPLFYQWLKNNAPIDGATGDALTITNAALTDAGDYSVVVSNRVNAVTSRQAHLNVSHDVIPPTIAQVSGSATKVIVRFSEPLDAATANMAANYTLSGGGKVQAAALDSSDMVTVTLTTTPLNFGNVYTLSVSGVKDRFNNPANTTAPFRATILIDGDFGDWTGIEPADTETQDTPEGLEFKDIRLANDDDYLYIRFSFYANVGQLPVDAYFHIFSDADNDPTTGFGMAGIGSEMMIENGGGYQQKGGQFNEGGIRALDFAIAPAAKSSEFECRISRHALYDTDGSPVFTGNTVALVLQLVNLTWAAVDTAPVAGGIVYTFTKLTPMNPGPLHVRLTGGQVEISWSGPGTLEAKDTLQGGTWASVSNASSPYAFSPTSQQRFFRLKQ